jgi:hypothetical protein
LPLDVIAAETRSLPLLQAGWLDPLAVSEGVYPRDRDMTEQDVRGRIDAMHRLGMEIVIVSYVEYFGNFFYPSGVTFFDRDMNSQVCGQKSPFDFDLLEAVYSQASRNGMHVFVGLGRAGDSKLLWEFDKADWPERKSEALRVARLIAKELWKCYGHHRSFYGWYLSHEANDLKRASAYYDPLAKYLHTFSPDKPVMVAPAGTPIVDPRILQHSEVDIFCYQDAVGAGYVPYRYTYKPDLRLGALNEVFGEYCKAHQGSGKHLWADLEIWEMDGAKGYSGAYSASFARIKRQIDLEARYVDVLTANEVLGFLEPPDSGGHLKDQRAMRLFGDYEDYVRRVAPRTK